MRIDAFGGGHSVAIWRRLNRGVSVNAAMAGFAGVSDKRRFKQQMTQALNDA